MENVAIQDIAAGERLLSDREKVPNNADPQRNDTPLIVLKDEKVRNEVVREPVEAVGPDTAHGFSIPTNAAAAAADKLHTPKCAEARWYYLEEGEWKKMIDYESMVLEVKDWKAKGDGLDPEAQLFHDEVLAHFKFPESLPRCNLVPNPYNVFSDENLLRAWKPEPNFLKALYKVNSYNTKITAIYWSNDTMDIKKGEFFTVDGNPIDPDVAEKISRHLEKEKNYEYYVSQRELNPVQYQAILRPKELELLNGDRFVWSSLVNFTIQRKNKREVYDVIRLGDGNYKTEGYKPKHLIFVVHGILHKTKNNDDNKIHSVVKCAQNLNNGVDNETGAISELLFLPIHWRNYFQPHKCDKSCSKINVSYLTRIFPFLEDVESYCCEAQAQKIREIVVNEIKSQYRKFILHNPDFKGTVSFFGHSLGSVICYDILTMPGLGADRDPFDFKVDCLLTVGSPLRRFIEERGEPARNLFRETYLKLRIYNVFYKKDIIAEGLEPIVHPSYKYLPPVIIPSVVERNMCYIGIRFAFKPFVNAVKNVKRFVGNQFGSIVVPPLHLAERIDHIIQKSPIFKELWPHSLCWEKVAFHRFILSINFDKRRTCLEPCTSDGSTTDGPQPEQKSSVEEVCVETCDDQLNQIVKCIPLDSFGTTLRPLSAEEERDVEDILMQDDLFSYIPMLFLVALVFAVLVKMFFRI